MIFMTYISRKLAGQAQGGHVNGADRHTGPRRLVAPAAAGGASHALTRPHHRHDWAKCTNRGRATRRVTWDARGCRSRPWAGKAQPRTAIGLTKLPLRSTSKWRCEP